MSRTERISLSDEYDDIYSIEYKGVTYINSNYDSAKYGYNTFEITI